MFEHLLVDNRFTSVVLYQGALMIFQGGVNLCAFYKLKSS